MATTAPSELTNQPIVIDSGSGAIKAGFAGDNEPRAYFTACVGRPKHHRVMACGNVDGDHFVGRRAQELRGLLRIRYPMEHGVVTDWADMECIWDYLYRDELKIRPDEHPVLLTEAPLNPRKNRDALAQVFFETFNVPAMYIGVQAVLSLYASGRVSGLVLDSGDGVTHAVPVFEGFAIHSAVRRIDLGGRDISNYLQILLRRAGYAFATSAEMEIVHKIKEKLCYVSLNPNKEEAEFIPNALGTTATASAAASASAAGPPPMSSLIQDEFAMPDNRMIRLGTERFLAPEVLFQPDVVGLEYPGIHHMLADCILATDVDLRRQFYSSIVLSGGSTLYRGIGERLLNELKTAAVSRHHRDIKIKIYAPPERKYSTWIGGSILAALNTFKKMWVSAEEYREDPDVVHRRMFG